MTETSLYAARAAVHTYGEGKWNVKGGGYSRLDIYTTGTAYRIVGRSMQNQNEWTIITPLLPSVKYQKVSPQWHQITDASSAAWGLNFATEDEGTKFSTHVYETIEKLKSGGSAPSPPPPASPVTPASAPEKKADPKVDKKAEKAKKEKEKKEKKDKKAERKNAAAAVPKEEEEASGGGPPAPPAPPAPSAPPAPPKDIPKEVKTELGGRGDLLAAIRLGKELKSSGTDLEQFERGIDGLRVEKDNAAAPATASSPVAGGGGMLGEMMARAKKRPAVQVDKQGTAQLGKAPGGGAPRGGRGGRGAGAARGAAAPGGGAGGAKAGEISALREEMAAMKTEILDAIEAAKLEILASLQ